MDTDHWGPDYVASDAPASEHPEARVTVDTAYHDPEYPGYAGREVAVFEAPVQWRETENGAFSDGWWAPAHAGVDPIYDIGGVQASPTDKASFSWGPVDPSTVENYELTGRIIVPGRDLEHSRGPVGATEYRDNLIMQIVQAMGPEVTAEAAAIGLLSGI